MKKLMGLLILLTVLMPSISYADWLCSARSGTFKYFTATAKAYGQAQNDAIVKCQDAGHWICVPTGCKKLSDVKTTKRY